jgi:protein O-mannosyl-transferase
MSPRLRDCLWGFLLAAVTFLAYQPAWNGQPIWDDAAHLTYPEHRPLSGLARIWTEPGATQQYYPVVYTAFWVEDKLWRHAMLGYHLVNILLHLTAAFLLLKILRTLQIPAAWLATAIFALHPVMVESVAWVSELKNTLSTICYFGAALAYLRFDRTRNKRAYALALVIFAVGLMAKTVIATLPAALLVVFWWQRGRLSWKQDVPPLVPFFATGIAAGLFTSWMERNHLSAQGSEFNFSAVERFLIAGRAIWFYLSKLIWPSDLIFSYPRWKISQFIWWQYLYPLAAFLLLAILWMLRKATRGPLAAALFFVGTLFPALGFFNVYPFKFSFVADHFQYVAACGPIVLASVGIDALFCRLKSQALVWERICCAALLAVLGLLTWRQSRIYTDMETLWRATIARNPESWLACQGLGGALLEKGEVDQSITWLQKSLAIRPDNPDTENNLGVAFGRKGMVDEAIQEFRKAVATQTNFAEAYGNLGNSLAQKGNLADATTAFQQAILYRPDLAHLHFDFASALLKKGDIDGAIAQLQKTIELRPADDQAHFQLGVALRQKGRANEAIGQFQEAVAIRPDFAEGQNDLGYSLLDKGKVDEAIAHLNKAIEIQPTYAEAHYNLGNALLREGQVDGAIAEFQKLLTLRPNSAEGQRMLAGIAWRMATAPDSTQRNGARAIELAMRTDQLSGGNNPMMAAILAAAYAEGGQFGQAVVGAQRALKLAEDQKNTAMVAAIQAQLRCYEAHSPFRDTRNSP